MTGLPWRRRSGADAVRAAAARTPWPLWVAEVDLASPLATLTIDPDSCGAPYVGAVVAVRLHTRPLGFVAVPVSDGAIHAQDLAQSIWEQVGEAIEAHCQLDGLPAPNGSGQLLTGLGSSDTTACLAARRAVLADPIATTIVVATRDRAEGLRLTLAALRSQCYPRFEILVVDNAPTTGETFNLVTTLMVDGGRLRYVREDRPGLGWAHRRGLAEATGEIVAFTDDDVHVDRHWLAGLLEGFAATDRVGSVTGLVLPRELETPSQVWYEQYGGFAKGFERRIFDLHAYRPADPLFPFTVGRLGAGASMAFRREALERAGGFDPALGPGTPTRGGEDLDVFFKILANGWRHVYEPAALAYHTHRREYAELRSQLSTWGIGYSAFLTSAMIGEPGLAMRILPRLPAAVRHAIRLRTRDLRVAANAYPDALTQPTYPPDLRRAELLSVPAGPLAYLRGRAHVRAQVAAANGQGQPAREPRGASAS